MLQVVGELVQQSVHGLTQVVLGIAAHLVGEVHQLAIDTITNEVVDELGRPAGRVTHHHTVDGVARAQCPLKGTVAQQLDHRRMPVFLEDRREHPAHRRPPFGLGNPAHDDAVYGLLHVLVAQHLSTYPEHRGSLCRDPLGMRPVAHPLAQPTRDLSIPHFGGDDGGRHKVLPDEVPEPLTQLILLALDDRCMRNL
ncbi:Uncharacterised protein [Mycobacteroides abscessus subsp. abscessus]|nr:Uncharacterised protein [Mycobacteroides abscessus subsp. abscessus]